LAAVLAVGAACWLGCGDDDDSSSYYYDDGGGSGSNSGDSVGTPAYSNKCGKDGTADSCRKVEIGGSTWMAENLNYQPPTGNSWCYNDADSNCAKYGRLYDWNTAMAGAAAGTYSVPSGVQGVCPSGWHLPSRGEWGLLGVAAGGTGPYGDLGTVAGKKLKAKSGWINNNNGTDDFEFSALPGGQNNDGSFSGVGGRGNWWSSSEGNSISTSAYRRYILDPDLGEGSSPKFFGFSVRCVEDKDVVQYKVTVSTAGTDANGGGDYIAGATVGINAGTAPTGMQFKNWTSSNSGVIFADANIVTTTFTMPAAAVTVTANFELAKYEVTVSSAGSGATGSGSYTAGAVVSINAGTAPAGQVFKNWTSSNSGVIFANANSAATTFTMPAAAVTVTANFVVVFVDGRNGRIYKTVVIGGKNWMAENLNFQTLSGSWCYSNSFDNCTKYGRLYDWNTAKTVCPTGWHLPSRDEWGVLAKAAGGIGDYGAGGTAGNALKSTSGWNYNGNGTDTYGFSALTGGFRDPDGSFNGEGDVGIWWTATEDGSKYAIRRIMYYLDAVPEDSHDKGDGYSVRCVAD